MVDAGPSWCPDTVRVDILWEDWWVAHLLWPLVVQISLTVVFRVVVRPLYVRTYRRSWKFKTLIQKHIGTTQHKKVLRPKLLLSLRAAQIVSSFISVTVWVSRTYSRGCTVPDRAALLLATLVDLLNWAANRLRAEGAAYSLWEANGVVDALTLVPALRCGLFPDVCRAGGADWLTLHFLRSMVLSFNFHFIQETGWMQRIPRRILFIVQLALRVLSLIFVMAGTIFTCELLGDPAFLVDSYVQTAHGDQVSVAQMLYWIVISLTTVGYGDFAPKALISRMLTAVFIIYGICNVFLIQYSFTQLWSRYREGSGSYRPWRHRAPHIVVILGIRGSASKLSSVLAGFLLELLHPAHNGLMAGEGEGDWPNVVLVSPSLWEEERGGVCEDSQTASFEDFLLAQDLPTEARGRVWFLVGSSTDPETLRRANVGSSVLTFILTDMKSLTPDEDDGQNIYTAMLVRKLYPLAQLRLMLVRPESRNLAVQSGVEATSCFSARELTAHILAQNVRCHGLLPMITGLFKSWDLEDVEHFLDHVLQRGDGLPIERKSLSRTSLPSMGSERSVTRSLVGSSASDASSHCDNSAPVGQFRARGRVDRAESVLLAVRASMPSRLHAPPGERSSLLGFASERLSRLAGSTRLSSQPRTSASIDESITESHRASIASDNSVTDFWMFQYFHGLSQGVYGFALSEEFDGEWFGKVAYDIFKLTGAILLGVFSSDRVHICPQNLDRPLRTGQICFAVARSSSALDPCRLQTAGSDWRRHVMESRAQVQMNHVRHGTHVAAAKLMGHQLRRRMTVSYSGAVSPSSYYMQRKLEAAGQSEGAQTPGGVASQGSVVLSEELGPSEAAKDIDRALEIRRGLSEHDELTVVVVCNGEVWQQVRTFVQSLRAPFQPTARQTERPVIILAPTAPPAGLVEELGVRIGFLRGSSLSAEDLVDAGVLEAKAVVVMSGATPSRGTFREPLFRDCRVVLCSQEIECWCGFSKHEVFAAYELQDSRSARHLPEPARGRRACLQEVLTQAEHVYDDVETEANGRTRRTMSNGTSVTAARSAAEEEEGDAAGDEVADEAVKDSILFNSRFAAGQVFSPELFGTMLGRMYYMPAIIELVEALLMPHVRRQKAFMWQMRVPPHYIGKEFGELFRDLSLGELGAREARSSRLGGGPRRGSSEVIQETSERETNESEADDTGRASGHDSRASAQGWNDAPDALAPPGRSSEPAERSSAHTDEFQEAPLSPTKSALTRGRSSARFARTLTWRSSTFSQTSVTQVHEPPALAPPEPPPGCLDERGPGEMPIGEIPIMRPRKSCVSVFSAFGSLASYNSMFDLTTGDHLQEVGPAVPIALYRFQDKASDKRLSPGTGGHNFSFLAPGPKQKLTSQDWVTVLGSRAFGTKVDEMGLLRGSSHGPARDIS